MTKHKSKSDVWEWMAPAFIVIAILAVFLAMTYMPLAQWGININTGSLWFYMPWLVAFAVGLYALKQIYRSR